MSQQRQNSKVTTLCQGDNLLPETEIAVMRVLKRLGHAAKFPIEQTFCGQMYYNTGHQAEAVPLCIASSPFFGMPRLFVFRLLPASR